MQGVNQVEEVNSGFHTHVGWLTFFRFGHYGALIARRSETPVNVTTAPSMICAICSSIRCSEESITIAPAATDPAIVLNPLILFIVCLH